MYISRDDDGGLFWVVQHRIRKKDKNRKEETSNGEIYMNLHASWLFRVTPSMPACFLCAVLLVRLPRGPQEQAKRKKTQQNGEGIHKPDDMQENDEEGK